MLFLWDKNIAPGSNGLMLLRIDNLFTEITIFKVDKTTSSVDHLHKKVLVFSPTIIVVNTGDKYHYHDMHCRTCNTRDCKTQRHLSHTAPQLLRDLAGSVLSITDNQTAYGDCRILDTLLQIFVIFFLFFRV